MASVKAGAVVIFAAASMLAGCSSGGTSSSTNNSTSNTTKSSTSNTPTLTGAVFENVPCPKPVVAGVPDLDFPPSVQCGFLTARETRAKPDGRKIKIFVMRAPATSSAPQPDPIVYLSGGPGGGGSFEVATMIKQGLNADREVIFVDQRGTHLAEPFLGCPEVDEFVNDALSLPFAAESTTAANTAADQKCRDRLAATGVDLSAYNTAENAADIADLRVALGIPSWNVYGVSYGTNLALSLLRDHPQGIRSVVLDSVSPPANNMALNWWEAPAEMLKAVFAACEAQPSCAAAHPNLEADFTATVNRLDQTPIVVQTTDASGASVTVNVDGFAFLYSLIVAAEHDASGIPKLISETARGSSDAIVDATVASRIPPALIGVGGTGLALGVFCREDANLTTEEAALAKSKSVLPGIPDRVLRVQPKQGRLFTDCPVWDVGRAAPAASAPTVSDVPVLILEGTFDAATAPSWVGIVTPTLKSSQVVEFPFTGHGVLGKSMCALNTMTGFADNPTQPVDHTCANQTTLTFASG